MAIDRTYTLYTATLLKPSHSKGRNIESSQHSHSNLRLLQVYDGPISHLGDFRQPRTCTRHLPPRQPKFCAQPNNEHDQDIDGADSKVRDGGAPLACDAILARSKCAEEERGQYNDQTHAKPH
jgi:hypothetical protein